VILASERRICFCTTVGATPFAIISLVAPCRAAWKPPREIPNLTKDEAKGVMARRDKIVATFQSLVAQKGEKEVLY